MLNLVEKKNLNNGEKVDNLKTVEECECDIDEAVSEKLAKSGYKIYGIIAAVSFVIYGFLTIINIRLKTYNEPINISMSYVEFEFKDIYSLIFIGVIGFLIVFISKTNFNIFMIQEGKLKRKKFNKTQKKLYIDYLGCRIIFLLTIFILFNPNIFQEPANVISNIFDDYTNIIAIILLFISLFVVEIIDIGRKVLKKLKIKRKYNRSKDTELSLIVATCILVFVYIFMMNYLKLDFIEATSGVVDDIKKEYDIKENKGGQNKIIIEEFKKKFEKFDESKGVYLFKETEEYFYYINDGRVFQIKKFKG